MDLEKICKKVIDLAKTTGEFIWKERTEISLEKIEVKGLNDFVTYVDTRSEKKLTEGLLKILPNSGFIAEEKTITKLGEKYNWIIDPLDGTTNFIHGLSPYAISIALMEENRIILGLVYEISLQECFYAWKESKAWLNEKEINVSKAETLSNSLIATGFPYYEFSRMDEYLPILDFFIRNTHGVRRLGSAATDLSYVACGRFDGFYEYNLSPWDVAAGSLIIQQAGGKVSDFSGGNKYLFGKEIIATNSLVFNE